MGSVEINWDKDALLRYARKAPETRAEIESVTQRIFGQASSMGSSFRTGLYHRDHKSPAVGNTPARYQSNVEMHNDGYVGMVMPANYAAMKDNFENNTLLKAIG